MSLHLNSSHPSSLRTRALALVGALALLLGLGAVGAPSASAATAGAGIAWVRAAHLVPGIGSTRIDLAPQAGGATSSVVMSPGASYGDITSYQKVAPGTYTVSVRPTSGPGTGAAAPMLSRRFTIAKGQAMTLAVVGTEKAPRLATLSDDLTPPAAGQVNVRVFPAVSDAQQLSVQAVGGPQIVSDAVLGQATAYRAVPAGAWTLKVTADMMAASDARVKLMAGGVYTVVVLDAPQGGALQTKVVTDAAGMASALPKGGAQTGAGGTATDVVGAPPVAGSATSTGLLIGLGVLLTLGAGTALRRRVLVPVRVRR
jgi:hypothetical protein